MPPTPSHTLPGPPYQISPTPHPTPTPTPASVAPVSQIQDLTNLLEDRLELNRNILSTVRLVVVVLLVAHFSACGFFLVASLSDTFPVRATWVSDDDLADESVGVRYVAALYW